tara:strand:- start:3026 stop:4681 length:1656 start_codon:yes stop_codon:yes gene_type:complete
MLRFSRLDPHLLDPVSTPGVFNATLNFHGTYTTEHFVLRLSPRVHELVDAITKRETDGHDMADLIQAYSVYLHETIHWWQHMGSSAGLMLSLAYPAQVCGSMAFLQQFGRSAGCVKPVKTWAHWAMVAGATRSDPTLAAANIAVNNALDIDFYKKIALSPKYALELLHTPYFESVGHSYLKAYGETVFAIIGSCDLHEGQLPNPAGWDPHLFRLRVEHAEGFVHGSMPPAAEVGLAEIFEGQARFCQLQFLASSGGPELLESYREKGQFGPIYVSAFELFLRLLGADWPERYDDPLVGLFLLICDLAINPTRGYPLEIESFEDFICDVDAGARFTRLCLAAAEAPELQKAIQRFSAVEYEFVASRLADRCGYDHPFAGLDAIVGLIGDAGPIDALLEEHRTFGFGPVNMPVRVIFSHHIAFARDKRGRPEMFCWPGMWLAGERCSGEIQKTFEAHLSLFQDRSETEQIFPRAMPGRSAENIKSLVNGFFSGMLAFDLALQWTLFPGPFAYDFKWLTGKDENSELIALAKRQFEHNYEVDPDRVEVIDHADT